jgi:hypothetical protein
VQNMDENVLRQIYIRHLGQPGFVINTWEEYRDLVTKAYPVLVDSAKKGRFIAYGEVGAKIGLYVGSEYFQLKIGYIVGACSEYERLNGRPLISAIVVNDTTRYPGRGFWGFTTIPRKIRLSIQYSDIESGYVMSNDMLDFWSAEVKRIFEYWGSHDC